MIGGTHPVWDGVLLPLRPCERLTYLYLTARRNDDGHAWPRPMTVAAATGYSLPATKAALAELRKRGLIVHAGLIDPNHPQVSAVRWFLPPVVSPGIPRDGSVVSPTTPAVVLPTSRRGIAHDPHKKQGRDSSKKHTPLPPNGEKVRDVHVTIQDGFQRDGCQRIVGVATSEMVTTTTVVASTASSQVNAAEVQRVFDTWIESTGRTGRTRLDAKRRKVIQRALADYPLPDVLDAVRGWQHDPWPDRVHHTDITQLLRDAAHIEKFRRLQQEGPPRVRVRPKGAQAVANAFRDLDDDVGTMLFGGNGTGRQVVESRTIEGPR